MKKKIAIAMLVCMCGAALFAQKYTITKTEKNVTLPDGSVGDLSFFKKQSDLSNYAKHTLPQDKKTIYWTTKIIVKDEKELGNFHKTYNENENETVRKICELHKETDSKYSLAWVDLGDIVVRAVFKYKNGKLTYDRLNFFDENNEIYMDFLAKKNAREEKLESAVKNTVTAVFGGAIGSTTSSQISFEDQLYWLRHKTYEDIPTIGDPASVLRYRMIYDDDGRMIQDYIVGLDGTIYSSVSYITGGGKEIHRSVATGVSEKIRRLAQKSLD